MLCYLLYLLSKPCGGCGYRLISECCCILALILLFWNVNISVICVELFFVYQSRLCWWWYWLWLSSMEVEHEFGNATVIFFAYLCLWMVDMSIWFLMYPLNLAPNVISKAPNVWSKLALAHKLASSLRIWKLVLFLSTGSYSYCCFCDKSCSSPYITEVGT